MRRRKDIRAALERDDAGLTLLEVMVALMLVVSALLLALQWFPIGGDRANVRLIGRELALGLRQARTRALTANQPAGFIFDATTRSWRIGENGTPHSLPEGVEVRMQAADQLNVRPREGRIVFFPDGSSSGGVIVITARGRALRIEVDWLTGRIALAGGE